MEQTRVLINLSNRQGSESAALYAFSGFECSVNARGTKYLKCTGNEHECRCLISKLFTLKHIFNGGTSNQSQQPLVAPARERRSVFVGSRLQTSSRRVMWWLLRRNPLASKHRQPENGKEHFLDQRGVAQMLEANYKSPDGTRRPQIPSEFLLTCVADVVCVQPGRKRL